MRTKGWPLPLAEHDDGDFAPREVLLVTPVFVRCHEYFKTGRFGCRQKIAVFQPFPALLECFANLMLRQMTAQRCGRTVVQNDTHL